MQTERRLYNPEQCTTGSPTVEFRLLEQELLQQNVLVESVGLHDGNTLAQARDMVFCRSTLQWM